MTDAISITRLSPTASDKDFATCAMIHKEAISDGFLATLNPAVLERIYRTAADSEYAFVYVARAGDDIIGFICGSADTGRFYKDCVFRYFFVLAWNVIPALISWQTVRRIAETLFYPARKPTGPDLPEPEILNFCVSGQSRGTGVGGRLFAALVGEFNSRNTTRIRIVTGESQTEAISFYSTRGAELVQELEVHQGVKSFIFVYDMRGGNGTDNSED